MDKDLLRIVIIAVGAVLILTMIIWSVVSSRSKGKKINFYDDKDPLENIDPSLVVSTDDDDFDIVSLNPRENDAYQVTTHLNPNYVAEAEASLTEEEGEDKLATETAATDTLVSSKDKSSLPALIQLSLVATTEQGFSGNEILTACEKAGLIFGSVKVFERLDSNNQVEYAVASMLDSGVFPDDSWETYQCPGISFFMQPREVENAAEVFAEMIDTLGQLSTLLIGDVLDQNQAVLTQTALEELQASLL